MSNKEPTKLNILKKIRLVFLFIFNTELFINEEELDNKKLSEKQPSPDEPRAYKLKKAFLFSLLAIVITGISGLLTGITLNYFISNPNVIFTHILQMTAATILLWATLALKGWDIQSWKGITFTERMNQWIFRSLYCFGTFLAVVSIVWT